jgi:hypothetical protein
LTGPLLWVTAGQPDEEELAALVVVLAAVRYASATRKPEASQLAAAHRGRAAGGWADRARLLRLPPRPGPGAWRRSAWPG